MAKNDRVSCWTISGILLIAVAFVLVIFASAFPYWQETRKALDTGVPNIGLWEICFDDKGFAAPAAANDVRGKRYYGCNYVFDRDLEDILDWLFPDWFIAVATLVTLGLILMPIAIILSIIYLFRVCSAHYEHLLLGTSAILSVLNGLLTAIAIFVFGINAGEDQTWVVSPDTNYLSYSFGACAFVPVFCFFASMCHSIDFLRVRAQRLLNARAKIYAKGEFNDRF